MNEYLINSVNGFELVESEIVPSFGIEVPVGAEIAVLSGHNKHYFYKDSGNTLFLFGGWRDCSEYKYYKVNEFLQTWGDSAVIWRRKDSKVIDKKEDGIKETLNERNKKYGSFEDVAMMTQDFIEVMKKHGFDGMPKPHKEAMHMICSKMARLVNGDCNHIDSWHDIAGYATLVEEILKTENGDENEQL